MEEIKYKFEFNYVELNTLLKACRELPYKESASLINYLVDTYTKQAKEIELANKKAKEAS